MIWGKSFKKTLATFLLLVVVFSVVAPTSTQAMGGSGSAGHKFVAPDLYHPSHSSASGQDCDGIIDSAVCGIGYMIFSGIMIYNGLVVGISGTIFDFSLKTLAIDQDPLSTLGLSGAVDDLWSIFRDIGNLIIIFGLLYLAIKTIIEGNGFADKKVLATILIAAVLINFSLFFAKTAFTLSNKVAVEILKSIGIEGTDQAAFAKKMAPLALPNLFMKNKDNERLNLATFNNAPSQVDLIAQALFGAIVLTMLAFVLIFGSLFLVIRSMVFLFLFITAGLGFTARFIGFTKKIGDMWWDNLFKHTVSLPAFAILFYIALTVTSLLSPKIEFGNVLLLSNMNKIAASILYYIIIIAFFAVAVMAPMFIGGAGSKHLGSFAGWGKKHAKGFGNYVKRKSLAAAPASAGWAGRQVIGRWAGGKMTSDDMKQKALEGDKGAQRWLAAGAWLQKRTFDARNVGGVGKAMGIGMAEKGGWAQRKKDMKKEQEKQIKEQHEIYGVDDATKKYKDTPDYQVANSDINRNEEIAKAKQAKARQDLKNAGSDKRKIYAANFEIQSAAKDLIKIKEDRKKNDNKILNDFSKVMNDKNSKKVFTVQGLSNHFTRGRKAARRSAIETFVKSQTKDKSEQNNDKLLAAINASAPKTS